MKKKILFVLVLLVLLGCEGGQNPLPEATPPPPEKFVLVSKFRDPDWNTVRLFCDKDRGNLIYLVDGPDSVAIEVVEKGCE